jgi:hypothetical protein
MHSVAVGNKTLSLPALVPSISSFETQLDPLPALQLQQTLREPISLVSAYDLRNVGDELTELCKEYKKTAVLLLDSGEYEHSHVQRYAGGKAPSWGFDDFKKVCALNIHDFAFSYDYFWCDDPYQIESASDFELRLVGEFFNAHDFFPTEKLIPVLHLQTRRGDKRLDETQILNLVARIASECKSPFIAVAERELGDGLIDRFGLAKKICDQIARSNKGVALHVLGCGNLLSFAFMCVAGAKMADGLEWYRTFAASNFHLHHFQQEPLFGSASGGTYNPTADLILSLDVPYRVKVATRNLMSFQTFMAGLAPRLLDRTVHKLVTKNFGKKAGTALRAVET